MLLCSKDGILLNVFAVNVLWLQCNKASFRKVFTNNSALTLTIFHDFSCKFCNVHCCVGCETQSSLLWRADTIERQLSVVMKRCL